MKTIKALLGGLILAAVPLAAEAGEKSYSYLDAGWFRFDRDDSEADNGFAARGSVGFAKNFFAFADLARLDRGTARDVKLYAVGLGGHYPLNENLDFVGRAGVTRADVDTFDDDGYLVSLGVRVRGSEAFEVEAHAVYTDYGTAWGDGGQAELDARYYFTEHFALGGGIRIGDHSKTVYAGLRFAF